jgi:hypothetical protein
MSSVLQASLEAWYPSTKETAFEVGLGVVAGVGLHAAFEKSKKLVHCSASTESKSPVGRFYGDLRDKRFLRAGIRALFSVGLTPPIEETLFRGYMYLSQEQKHHEREQAASMLDKTKDITSNAALFAAAHIDPRLPWKQTARFMPGLFIGGVGLCALAELTGNLWASTVGHATVNALQLRIVARLK